MSKSKGSTRSRLFTLSVSEEDVSNVLGIKPPVALGQLVVFIS
jgi:hypothetical protein